jgi:hypothetical protein
MGIFAASQVGRCLSRHSADPSNSPEWHSLLAFALLFLLTCTFRDFPHLIPVPH